MFKKIKQKINNDKNQGFTLVESLISITILMISIAGPLNLAGQGLLAADIAEKQIIAFYLAQDATETIINIKTGNKLDNKGILERLGDCNVEEESPYGCRIDTDSGDTEECANENCATNGILYRKDSGQHEGLYNHDPLGSNVSDSGFTRYVKITPITVKLGIDDESEISTTVYWSTSNGTTQSYTLVTNISNW